MATTTHKHKRPYQTGGRTGVRQAEREALARKRRTRPIRRAILVGVVIAAAVAVVAWAAFRPRPGNHVPGLGNAHIDPAEVGTVQYNSTPPTSGPHLSTLAAWGVHDQPLSNEQQVHNLEDGGVLVQYDCPDGCPQLVAQLKAIVDAYPEGVILAPYPGIDARIALTAWQRIEKLDQVDEKRIERFIRAYRGIDHHPPGE